LSAGATSESSVSHSDVASVAEQIGRAAQALSLSSISAVEKSAVDTDGGGEDGAVGAGRAGDGGSASGGKEAQIGGKGGGGKFLVPLEQGMKVVAYFTGKKGCVGWYNATLTDVNEEADEYLLDWDDGEKKDRSKNAAHIALHLNSMLR
jgi:hypothetical protein